MSDAHEPDGPREERPADPQVDALLSAAHDRRAELAAQLKQVERDLRAARQGEHAERARRGELEEDAAGVRRRAEATIAGLRAALSAREERVAELEEERRRAPRGDGGEVGRLRAELERRGQVHDAVSRQLAELRTALQDTRGRLDDGGRSASAEAALADLGSTTARLRDELRILETERRGLEEQLAAARGQLTVERAARLDAEAALAERQSVEEEVARALADLRAELVLVREENAARDAREAQLEQLVAELVRTAEALRAGFEAELSELRTQLAAAGDPPAAVETVPSPQDEADAQAREDAAAALRAELARRTADAARAEERIVELEDELERARIALRPPAPMPPADHPALAAPANPTDAAPAEADSVIIDLARAAARLRTRREGEAAPVFDVEAHEPPVFDVERDEAPVLDAEADPDVDAEAPDPAEGPDAGDAVPDGVDAVDAAPDQEEAEAPPAVAAPPAVPAPPAAVPPPAPPALPLPTGVPAAVELGARFGAGARPAGSPWLAEAITRVAGRDPQAAAQVITALLPLQATRLRRELTYDLAVEGQTELRVVLHRDGSAEVTAAAPGDGRPAFRLAGSPVALAYYAGGGIGHRTPPGVVISGRRRRARRLAKAMREPLALPALDALGTSALLRLLATAIDPARTREERFTVAFAAGQEPPSAHVVVAAGMPVEAREGAPVHAAATVRTGPDGLAAFLGGTGSAHVTGDAEAVRRLLAWADAAQGLRA